MKLSTKRGLAAIAAALLPSAAFAHPSLNHVADVTQGFAHPLTGLDHILAMGAVGSFAFMLGGRARWLLPASFIAMMAVGGLLGMQGIAVPFVEAGIAASLVVLGLAVALGWRPSVAVAMGVTGLFAVFHGHAHGAEMPLDASGLEYGIGFMVATAFLHASGLFFGAAVTRFGQAALRVAGAVVSLAGVGLLSGLI